MLHKNAPKNEIKSSTLKLVAMLYEVTVKIQSEIQSEYEEYSGVPLLCRFLGDKIFENRHKTGKFSGELG